MDIIECDLRPNVAEAATATEAKDAVPLAVWARNAMVAIMGPSASYPSRHFAKIVNLNPDV